MPTNPTEQVDAVQEARELAIYVEGVAAGVQDIRLGKAAMALKTLADEVERLHERFSVVCNNCGERYLGPKNESLHGYNVCDMSRCED